MATIAVGDVQGCSRALRQVLEEASFDARRDRVWLTGDLVNHGPDSVGVLRWARSLGERAVVVLGNHDLHLLAIAHGKGTGDRCRATLAQILREPDGGELIGWLGRQKLMHHEGGLAMVHAGLLPQWSIAQALELAAEVERELRRAPGRLLGGMYGDHPARWSDALAGAERHRCIINAMTRCRMLDRSGAMALSWSDAPGRAPPGHSCWFDAPGRASAATPIVCGHWAALGLVLRPDLLAIDTGCGTGGELTAVRLEDRAVFRVACGEGRALPAPTSRLTTGAGRARRHVDVPDPRPFRESP